MALNGVEPTLNKIRDLGDKSYCTDGVDTTAGLASAIGGCGAKQVEHANAFATFARMGAYKPVTGVLEVKNSSDQVVSKWEDKADQVIDAQTAYIISDILTDDSARSGTFGWRPAGFYVPGVKTATKTGTSDLGGRQKDLWMMSYTPKATLSLWFGNHVPQTLRYGDGMSLGPYVSSIMRQAHLNVFQPDGTWKAGDWFARPNGIQQLNLNGRTDIYPSWFNRNKIATTTVKMTFDKVSKKKATDCTPEAAKETLDVIQNIDPVTRQTTYSAPDGYDAKADDDVHRCDDTKPFVSVITATPSNDGRYYTISAMVRQGTHPLQSVVFSVGGKTYDGSLGGSGSYDIVLSSLSGSQEITVEATDSALYTGSGSQTINFASAAVTP
jgi:membrane peptidoglycan carboxypeptidase